MIALLTINQPFKTVDDFHRRAGKRLGTLVHQLAGEYPQLDKRCGTKRVLLALSVAWALLKLAKEGDTAAFEHIDEALSPPVRGGCVMEPPFGCVKVEGVPFIIGDGEQTVLHFLWDVFTIFIDHEGADVVGQPFFDLADCRQSWAYKAISEAARMEEGRQEAIRQEAIRQETAENLPVNSVPPAVTEETTPAKTAVVAPAAPAASEKPINLSGREYLGEIVDCVVAHGNEEEVRGILYIFSYIPRHNDYLDYLRKCLMDKIGQLNAQRQPIENHFNINGTVEQLIAQGNGERGVKELLKIIQMLLGGQTQ